MRAVCGCGWLCAEEDQKKYLSQWSSIELTLKKFEEEMSKLQHATGLTDPAAIVNKFIFKGEVKQQLQAEIEDKEQRIRQLTQELAAAKEQLSQVKGDHKEHSWRDVEALAEQAREVEQRVTLAQTEVSDQCLCFFGWLFASFAQLSVVSVCRM
jgi:hypothetical protein